MMSNVNATDAHELREFDVPDWVNLSEDEHVVWEGSPAIHPYILDAKDALIPIVFFVGAGVAGYLMMQRGGELGEFGQAVVLMGGLLALVGILAIGENFKQWLSHEYLLTNQDAYTKRGILSRSVHNVAIDDVQKSRFDQSWFGRKFDYGTVRVATAGTGGSEIVLRNVRHPQEVSEIFDQLGEE